MSEPKKLILHVGMHKTATSALQRFVYQNRKLFENHGCRYPDSGLSPIGIEGRLGAHHQLAVQLRQSKELQASRTSFRQILNMVEKESLKFPSTLISSEVFSEQIHHEELRTLSEQFDTVKVIIYLRRQDELCESVYNQEVKTHYNSRKSTLTIRESLPGRPTYTKTLNKWSSLFGHDNIIVRPFETESFHSGNIFSDFLYYGLGIKSLDPSLRSIEVYNRRLCNDTLEYKRLINHLDLSANIKLATVPLLLEFDKVHQSSPRSTSHLLSPIERRKIFELFEEDNARVAREYLGRGDGRLFIRPPPDPNEQWIPYSGLTEEVLISITNFIAREDPTLRHKLVEGVKRALASEDDRVRAAAEFLLSGFSPTVASKTA